jgi:cell division protein FtsN
LTPRSKAGKKRAQPETPASSDHTPITVVAKTTEENPAQAPQSQSEEKQHVTEPENTEGVSESHKDDSAAPEQSREVQRADKPERTRALQGQRRVSYPYSIYLGSYKTRGRAKRAISIYEQKGLSPYWVEVDLGAKGKWFRVFAEYFKNREDAEAFMRMKKLSDAESKHTKYANLVGVFESEEKLEGKKQVLRALDYFPYVIKGMNGEPFLFTGAFYQRSRAEKVQKELASKGIESQVVER